MARLRQPENSPRSFVASATRLPPLSRRQGGRAESWQHDAWIAYDTVSELRYIANWVGNVMSRALLLAARRDGQSMVPEVQGPAAEAMDAYFGGFQGQSQMLQATGVNLTVAGEAFHVGRNGGNETVLWDVLGSGQVQSQGKKVVADWGEGKKDLKAGDLAIRVWTPHPRDPFRADSPTRSNLRTLGEITSINDHVQAQLISRLAGAGLLMLPNEMQFPVAPGSDPAANQADAFLSTLGEAMMTPIEDRASANSVVPIVVTAPGETLGNAKHLTFWTELDDAVIGMRDAAVRRLAIGMDTPPEVLLGVSDSNHWSAWLVDEAAIKTHLEPRLAAITHAITIAYLRPALEGVVDNPEEWYCVADTTEIRLRPNRSQEALELYDRGLISGEAARTETGFKPEDAPSLEESRDWLLRRIATGSTSPDQTAAALKILGASLAEGYQSTAPEAGGENTPVAPQVQPRRSLVEHPTQGPPNQADAEHRRELPSRNPQSAALLSACEGIVLRCLERAGNKLINNRARTDSLHEIPARLRYLKASGPPDKLLDGSFDLASEVLQGLHDEPDEVVAMLDFYVRGLLTNQKPYSRNTLEILLKGVCGAVPIDS